MTKKKTPPSCVFIPFEGISTVAFKCIRKWAKVWIQHSATLVHWGVLEEVRWNVTVRIYVRESGRELIFDLHVIHQEGHNQVISIATSGGLLCTTLLPFLPPIRQEGVWCRRIMLNLLLGVSTDTISHHPLPSVKGTDPLDVLFFWLQPPPHNIQKTSIKCGLFRH